MPYSSSSAITSVQAHSPLQPVDFADLLARKGLSLALLTTPITLRLEDSLRVHAAWAWENIYQVPYPGHTGTLFAREFHGMAHVSQAALYIPVFANLFRKHGHEGALALNDEDIRLLQIAALFHDAARENDNADLWDHESALMLYAWLTRGLHVDLEKARKIAEATANKDIKNNRYFRIQEQEDGTILSGFVPADPNRPKSIRHILIHDSDCAEMFRASIFDAQYLDFYQLIARDNPRALEDMDELVCECRSQTERRGDTWMHRDNTLKARYECAEGFAQTEADMRDASHRILHLLSQKLLPAEVLQNLELVDTHPWDPQAGNTDINLQRALKQGKVLMRSVPYPADRISAPGEPRTQAELETQKTHRSPGIATSSSKPNRLHKDGNRRRSASLVHSGAAVMGNSGFVIMNPDMQALSGISAIDADTGYGKKHRAWSHAPTDDVPLSEQFQHLRHTLRLGGKARRSQGRGFFIHHNELGYDCRSYQAVYFTQDRTLISNIAGNGFLRSSLPLLEAVYLRQVEHRQRLLTLEKYRQTFPQDGEQRFIARFGTRDLLPILEYSGLHNRLRAVPESELTEAVLFDKWLTLCEDWMRSALKSPGHTLHAMDGEAVRIAAFKLRIEQTPVAADCHYSRDFQQHLSAAIEQRKESLLQEDRQRILDITDTQELLRGDDFWKLMASPDLLAAHADQIAAFCIEQSLRPELFAPCALYVHGDITHLEETMTEMLHTHKKAALLFKSPGMRVIACSMLLQVEEAINTLKKRVDDNAVALCDSPLSNIYNLSFFELVLFARLLKHDAPALQEMLHETYMRLAEKALRNDFYDAFCFFEQAAPFFPLSPPVSCLIEAFLNTRPAACFARDDAHRYFYLLSLICPNPGQKITENLDHITTFTADGIQSFLSHFHRFYPDYHLDSPFFMLAIPRFLQARPKWNHDTFREENPLRNLLLVMDMEKHAPSGQYSSEALNIIREHLERMDAAQQGRYKRPKDQWLPAVHREFYHDTRHNDRVIAFIERLRVQKIIRLQLPASSAGEHSRAFFPEPPTPRGNVPHEEVARNDAF